MTRISRRRFLTISACAGAALGVAPEFAVAKPKVHVWKGTALGAHAEIKLTGLTESQAQHAFQIAKDTLVRVVRAYSLYEPTSDLSRLNRDGEVQAREPGFGRLLAKTNQLHHKTDGLFDPTIQPLWNRLARAEQTPSESELSDLLARIGWHHLEPIPTGARFKKPGMAASFNGIAQGFATDRVTDQFQRMGLEKVLVNIGEYRAIGGPFALGVGTDLSETLTLENRAVATSEPDALRFESASHQGHILSPRHGFQNPIWRSMTVMAPTATEADALSTAFSLASAETIQRLLKRFERVEAIGYTGDNSRIHFT